MIHYHYQSVNPQYDEQPETWRFSKEEKLHYRVFLKNGELTTWVFRDSNKGTFLAARPGGAREIETDDYDIQIIQCKHCAPCRLCLKRFNWKNNFITTFFTFLIWSVFGQFALLLPYKAFTTSELINPLWAWVTTLGFIFIVSGLIKYTAILPLKSRGFEGRMRYTAVLFTLGFSYNFLFLGPIYLAANLSGPNEWVSLAPMQFRSCYHESPSLSNNYPNHTFMQWQIEPASKRDDWYCFVSENCGHPFYSWRNRLVTSHGSSHEAPRIAPNRDVGSLAWATQINGFFWVFFALENTFDYLLIIGLSSFIVTVINRLVINGFWVKDHGNGGGRFIQNHFWFNAADILNIQRLHRVGYALLILVCAYNAYFIWSVSMLTEGG